MPKTVKEFRDLYGTEWIKRFRITLAESVGTDTNILPDIHTIQGPRTLSLSIYAGQHSGSLRALLTAHDLALTRSTIPWATDFTPHVGWDKSGRLLLEVAWPDKLADKDVRSGRLLKGDIIRKVRKGLDWLVGVDRRYNPVLASLVPSRGNAHYLFSGETQTGKTVALHSMILQLALCTENKFLLLCPSRRKKSFTPLKGLRGMVFPVAENLDQSRAAMAWAAKQIPLRLQNGSTGSLIVAIDEIQALRYDDTCTTMLKELTSEGAEAGVHIIGATQRPIVSELGILGGIVKANMGGRLALRVSDIHASSIALGQKHSVKLNTLQGQGDAILNTSAMEPVRLQVSHFTPNEIRTLLQKPVKPTFTTFHQTYQETVEIETKAKYTSNQVGVALVLRLKAKKAGTLQDFGRNTLMRQLEMIKEPLSTYHTMHLIRYVDRIISVLDKGLKS